MKPRMNQLDDPQQDLYRIELLSIIDTAHPLVKLAAQFNWQAFDPRLGLHYDEQMGAPAKSTRLMVGLHYLKHTFDHRLPGHSRQPLRWTYVDGDPCAGRVHPPSGNHGRRFCEPRVQGARHYTWKAVVRIAGQGYKTMTNKMKKLMRRRSAIEPLIGHMKSDGRLDRNHLKGQEGDKMNALFSACCQNMRLLPKVMCIKGGIH